MKLFALRLRALSLLSLMALMALMLALGGCATHIVTTDNGLKIDTSRNAKGQDSRAMFIVIHYTVANFPLSMKILSEREVSAHYLISDEAQPRVFRLVDENRRAWHSGVSGWKGHRLLNASSIGIEIVHPGFKIGPDKQRIYLPFPQAQIDTLTLLLQDIVQRHQVRPDRILGHGEVTPAYKEDPGPTFPWQQLAERGITPPWPDAQRVAQQRVLFEGAVPDANWFQLALAQWGYVIANSGVWDEASRRVLLNFQMRYRPANYDAQPDAESAALLRVLNNPPAPAAAAQPGQP